MKVAILILALTLNSSFVFAASGTSNRLAFGLTNIVKKSDVPNQNAICDYVSPVSTQVNDCLMSYEDAKAYCANIGKHLPTDREFAKIAMSLGAAGIREPAHNDSHSEGASCVLPADMVTELQQNQKEGYYPVRDSFNRDSKGSQVACGFIDFYFSSKGFSGPVGVLAKYQNVGDLRYFWSLTPYAVNTAVTFSDWDGPNQQMSKGRLVHFGTLNPEYDKLPVVCTK